MMQIKNWHLYRAVQEHDGILTPGIWQVPYNYDLLKLLYKMQVKFSDNQILFVRVQ